MVKSEKTFEEGDEIVINAEHYNKNYELDNKPEVLVKIKNIHLHAIRLGHMTAAVRGNNHRKKWILIYIASECN